MTPTNQNRPAVAAAVIRGLIAQLREPAAVVNGRWKVTAQSLGARIDCATRVLEGVVEELETETVTPTSTASGPAHDLIERYSDALRYGPRAELDESYAALLGACAPDPDDEVPRG